MAPAATAATAAPAAPARRAFPDPGEAVPRLALPTLGLFAGALVVWGLATWAAVGGHATPWVTIPLHAAVSFVMFTVLHDAAHHSIGRNRWLNALMGRLAMPFVAAYASFPMIAHIHIEHHRNTNEEADTDPDAYTSHGPWWQLPLRWLTVDAWYARFYLARRRSRPRAERAETAGTAALAVAGLAAAAATGSLWTLAVVYLIPQRIAIGVLAWWFDWLPHHGLEDTQRENRYRATRIRVGLEWLMTPLMLSQNYHLVHHLHPSIPFYRYVRAWRRNEEAYVEREAAIATVLGQQLSPEEYRVWRDLDSALARLRPVRLPEGSPTRHAAFHSLRVAEVRPLTADSVLIEFDVPNELAGEFAFTHGQHVTVRTDLGGQGVRRNYSICSPATGAPLRIAVKRIPGGAFSTYAMERLRAGDRLEVMSPSGRFSTPLDPAASRHYAAIAAGSGITPILSILATTLEVEADSRFTLVYGSRTRGSTMFRDEVDALASRYADRLQVIHVLSREPHGDPLVSGRIDRDKLTALMSGPLRPDGVDEWFLCGPIELVELAREMATAQGADARRLHAELFHGYAGERDERERQDAGPAAVTLRLGGEDTTFELRGGQTVLEGALGVRGDVPYACMGGACGTCRARLLEGTVEMDHNHALGQDDLDRGYVLTCQSHPTSPAVRVDYDA